MYVRGISLVMTERVGGSSLFVALIDSESVAIATLWRLLTPTVGVNSLGLFLYPQQVNILKHEPSLDYSDSSSLAMDLRKHGKGWLKVREQEETENERKEARGIQDSLCGTF